MNLNKTSAMWSRRTAGPLADVGALFSRRQPADGLTTTAMSGCNGAGPITITRIHLRLRMHQQQQHGTGILQRAMAPLIGSNIPGETRRWRSSMVDQPMSVCDAYEAERLATVGPDKALPIEAIPAAIRRAYPSYSKEVIEKLAEQFRTHQESRVRINDNATSLSLDSSTDHAGVAFITKHEFEAAHDSVEQVDSRIYRLAALTIAAGSAVGVVVPALPMLAVDLGISSADFGVVVSALAITKLLGNIPSTNAADGFGRKNVMVAGLAILGASNVAIGLATGLEPLVFARLMTGVGVAMFVTASTLQCIDLSTPINRARTFAPVGIAFSIGATIGPAIGGLMTSNFGLSTTFYAIGGVFGALSILSHVVLNETLSERIKRPEGYLEQMREEVKDWIPLLKVPEIKRMAYLNTAYWIAFSGAQMTLLPLILLEGDKFNLGASGVGMVFGAMSLINVAFAQPAARLADKVGKVQVVMPALLLVSGAYATLPMASTIYELAGVIGVLGLGNALLGNAIMAHAADEAPDESKSKAMALMRSMSDVGMLTGATSAGSIAAATSKGIACQLDAGFLALSLLGFGIARMRAQNAECDSGSPALSQKRD